MTGRLVAGLLGVAATLAADNLCAHRSEWSWSKEQQEATEKRREEHRELKRQRKAERQRRKAGRR